MSDTDPDNIDDVDSDDKIYGAVNEDGQLVFEDVQRPNLPDIHEVGKVKLEHGELAIDDIGGRWFVVREGDQIGQDFETWIPADEIDFRPASHVTDNIGNISVDYDGTAVQVDSDAANVYATEVFSVRGRHLSDVYSGAVRTGQMNEIRESHSFFDHEDAPVSTIPDEYIDNNGQWVRGADTNGHTNETTFEIFVPLSEFEIDNAPGNPKIMFTENSITRKCDEVRADRRPVTERQNGLYVDQFQLVSEDAVPDTDADFVGGQVYNPE